MIPKHEKDHKIPNNHRPKSLINTLGKVFEITLAKRLKIDILSKIRPEQFAFRLQHSTTSQLIKLVDYLANTTNRGEKTAAVFLDLEKAFDKVWHDRLLHKLIQLRTTHKPVAIIKSFISESTFEVRVDGETSVTRFIEAGVTQGSCLSPLLFIAYINDLPLTTGAHINLFADDTMLYATSMSLQHATKKLQTQIDTAIPWFENWKLTLNKSETEAMRFGKHIKTKINPPTIQGTVIPWSNKTKYLGIILDSHLTFCPHIKEITTKTKLTRAALYLILNNHNKIPTRTKINICRMYVKTNYICFN